MANVTQAELQAKLDELSQLLGQATVEYVEGKDYANHTELNDAVANLQSQITAITEMDDNGVQSIAEKVKMITDALKDENGVVDNILGQIRDNATAIATEVSRAQAAEATLQSQIDAITGGGNGSISDLSARVGAIESDLNDASDADGNIVKGLKSRVNDLESEVVAAETRAKDYADGKFLGSVEIGGLSMCASANGFRQALGLSALTCNGGTSGDGAVI